MRFCCPFEWLVPQIRVSFAENYSCVYCRVYTRGMYSDKIFEGLNNAEMPCYYVALLMMQIDRSFMLVFDLMPCLLACLIMK